MAPWQRLALFMVANFLCNFAAGIVGTFIAPWWSRQPWRKRIRFCFVLAVVLTAAGSTYLAMADPRMR